MNTGKFGHNSMVMLRKDTFENTLKGLEDIREAIALRESNEILAVAL